MHLKVQCAKTLSLSNALSNQCLQQSKDMCEIRTDHLTVGSLICNACLHLLLALLDLQSKVCSLAHRGMPHSVVIANRQQWASYMCNAADKLLQQKRKAAAECFSK